MSCPKHKRYKAKRKPRVTCSGCWHFYVMEHDCDEFDSEDMLNALTSADKDMRDLHYKAELIAGEARMAITNLRDRGVSRCIA